MINHLLCAIIGSVFPFFLRPFAVKNGMGSAHEPPRIFMRVVRNLEVVLNGRHI